MSKENGRYIDVVVGVMIYNDKNEILLIQNKKWKDFWTVPGGHIEKGESIEETAHREIMEETGLEINDIEFPYVSEGIGQKEFFEDRHFIFINCFAKKTGGKETKTEEMTAYKWLDPKKALKMKISSTIAPFIEKFIEKMEDDGESWEHKYKRALADYQNLIKQHDKDKGEFTKYAINDFLHDILPVYDHLKMSLASLNGDEEKSPWVEGVKYVLKQFKDVLENKGIEEIKTTGEKFDHNTMEAMEGEGKKVKKEVMSGYKLNGRVIRPARVIVE